MKLVDRIIAFEEDQLDDDEVIALFQELVSTGLAWRLQGSYGRTAERMLRAGVIVEPLE